MVMPVAVTAGKSSSAVVGGLSVVVVQVFAVVFAVVDVLTL